MFRSLSLSLSLSLPLLFLFFSFFSFSSLSLSPQKFFFVERFFPSLHIPFSRLFDSLRNFLKCVSFLQDGNGYTAMMIAARTGLIFLIFFLLLLFQSLLFQSLLFIFTCFHFVVYARKIFLCSVFNWLWSGY